MDINLTTPALLFPAISLLMLAFTNRFVSLANVIRTLNDRYQTDPNDNILKQIANLRYRVHLIRNMQIAGAASLLCCAVSMFTLFAGWLEAGKWIFGIALVLMTVSLAISIRELQISVGALDLLLKGMEKRPGQEK
jgi:hypothetical protein